MDDRRWPTYPPRKIALDTAVASGTTPHQGSVRVRDTEGREYLDAVGGIGCLPLGHGHPKWIAAVEDQMRKLVGSAGTFWTEPQQELVDLLVARTPIENTRVFLGNTGTEVTEAAIKLALRATGRKVIVAFEKAFHGRTLGSIALTANPAYRAPYVSILGEADDRFARMNVARAPFGDLAAVERGAGQRTDHRFRHRLDRHRPPDGRAAKGFGQHLGAAQMNDKRVALLQRAGLFGNGAPGRLLRLCGQRQPGGSGGDKGATGQAGHGGASGSAGMGQGTRQITPARAAVTSPHDPPAAHTRSRLRERLARVQPSSRCQSRNCIGSPTWAGFRPHRGRFVVCVRTALRSSSGRRFRVSTSPLNINA